MIGLARLIVCFVEYRKSGTSLFARIYITHFAGKVVLTLALSAGFIEKRNNVKEERKKRKEGKENVLKARIIISGVY
jgi:hypothetical protein